MTTSAQPSDTVLDAVASALFAGGSLTRSELIASTRLSRPTVSGAVASLLASGRVEETTSVSAAGRGRPSTTIRLSRRRAEALGLEIGRAHVAVAIADASHRVVAAESRVVDRSTPLLSRARSALDLVEDTASAHGIDLSALRQVAVGTPGPRLGDGSHPAVDFSLARLERERAAVAATVSARFGVPAVVGNNTRFTALGEFQRRANGGDLVYLRVDEGIGGGIVQDGAIVSGSWGAAGEMGHVSVDPAGGRCPCGGRGCLELVASMPAILRAAGMGDASELGLRLAGDDDDDKAIAAVDDAARATGRVVAGVLSTANPSVVVIGGSVAELPGFLDRVETVARDLAPTWAVLDLAVEPALTDHLLGAIGAATAAARPLSAVARKEHRA